MRMNEMKSITRKLILKVSFISLITATASSLAVSVFAFASASSILQVDDLSISTISPAVIKMGVRNTASGEIDYYDQITSDNLVASGYQGLVDKTFYPVSSSFKDKWLIKNDSGTYSDVTPMFTKEYPSNGAVEFPGYDLSSKDYLSMEIFLKEEDLNSRDVNIYLKDLTVKANNSANLQKAKELSRQNNAVVTEDQLDKIADCIRVSILTDTDYYIIDPNKSGTTVLAGRLNVSDADEYYDTYGTNYQDYILSCSTKEALYGEYTGTYDKLVYDQASDTDSGLTDNSLQSSAFNAKTKAGISPLNVAESVKNGIELKEEDSVSSDKLIYASDSSSNTPLVSLSAGESHRIVISYYVEGWDLDCTNLVQYASFTSTFGLTGQYVSF